MSCSDIAESIFRVYEGRYRPSSSEVVVSRDDSSVTLVLNLGSRHVVPGHDKSEDIAFFDARVTCEARVQPPLGRDALATVMIWTRGTGKGFDHHPSITCFVNIEKDSPEDIERVARKMDEYLHNTLRERND